MKTTSLLTVALTVLLGLPAPAAVAAQENLADLQAMDANRLLDRVDQALFPESFVASMRMETTRPGRRDTMMLMENFHLEGSGTFMEVQEPSRSRGMRFLQKDDDLWMYNPRSGARRAIRLSPRDSFQGSVFSNSDVSDPDYTDDYRASHAGLARISHPELGSVETVRISARARHDEAGYGRIEMWLVPFSQVAGAGDAAGGAGGDSGGAGVMPLRFDYYSRSGLLFKRMTLSGIGQLAGALRPRVMRMESLEEEGAATTVTLEQLEARDELPARLFNQQELTR